MQFAGCLIPVACLILRGEICHWYMTPTLLIVDDEKPTREGLRAALEDRYDVYLAEDAKTATELLEKDHFDVQIGRAHV